MYAWDADALMRDSMDVWRALSSNRRSRISFVVWHSMSMARALSRPSRNAEESAGDIYGSLLADVSELPEHDAVRIRSVNASSEWISFIIAVE